MACLLKLAKPLLSPKRKQQTQHFDPTLCLCFFTTVFFPTSFTPAQLLSFSPKPTAVKSCCSETFAGSHFLGFLQPSQALEAFTGFDSLHRLFLYCLSLQLFQAWSIFFFVSHQSLLGPSRFLGFCKQIIHYLGLLFPLWDLNVHQAILFVSHLLSGSDICLFGCPCLMHKAKAL